MAKEKSRWEKRQQGKSRAERRTAKKDMYAKEREKDSVSKFNVNKSGKGQISKRELRQMIKMRKGTGESRQDVIDAVQNSGAELGKGAQKRFNKMQKRQTNIDNRAAAKEAAQQQQQQASQEQQTEENAQQAEDLKNTAVEAVMHVQPYGESKPYQPNQSAENTGDVNNETDIKNEQSQKIDQDNDINTNITGDGNQVFNNQDNSIRQYGGDNRSLVINDGNTGNQGGGSGTGGYEMTAADKAITYGTLGGFFGPDDSPAAQASFVDQQQTMNRDAQKRYAGMGLATAAQYGNFQGGNVNANNLNARIDGSKSITSEFYDRATVAESKTFGDRAANSQYRPTPFEFGDPLKPIESNAGEIAQGYSDELDDDDD